MSINDELRQKHAVADGFLGHFLAIGGPTDCITSRRELRQLRNFNVSKIRENAYSPQIFR